MNFPQNVLNIIIKCQTKFKHYFFMKKMLLSQIIFQKNYLMDMECHLLKQELYNINLDNLSNIKKMFDNIEIINQYNIYDINNTIKSINNLLIYWSLYVCPNNIIMILCLLIGPNWYNTFDEQSIKLINIIIKFFTPSSVWDSNYEYNIEIKPTSPRGKKIFGFNDIYTHMECSILLLGTNNRVNIMKNLKASNITEEKFGASIFLKYEDRYIVIQGLFNEDPLSLSNEFDLISDKTKLISDRINSIHEIDVEYRNKYLKNIGIRDILINDESIFVTDICKKYNEFKTITSKSKSLIDLINEFMMASKHRKIDLLTILLLGNNIEENKLAFVLFDIYKTKKNTWIEIYNLIPYNLRILLDNTKKTFENDEINLTSINEISYEKRINLLKCSNDAKNKAFEKLKLIKSNPHGDSKAQFWLDGFLKIPFGNYIKNPVISFKSEFIDKIYKLHNVKLESSLQIEKFLNKLCDDNLSKEWHDYTISKKNFMKNIESILNDCVYGHTQAKLQLERIFAQWINGKSNGAILGLQGPPGTGKTSLAKLGLAKCLNNSSFMFLPIGGSSNGSTLIGHDYTYVGSTWGRIVDILMVCGCMNPIIFIDEIDKVSKTDSGREIISILTHLTDSTQNDEFEDKFFSGIKLDLSKALIIFSFNDPELIDPILRDRITIIVTHPLKIHEKITIVKDYMFNNILKEIGFAQDEIIIDDYIIKYIIETWTNEAGIRKAKELFIEIVRDINLNLIEYSNILPFTITQDYVDLLFETKLKIKYTKIHHESLIGLVNGLYATNTGLGGIMLIQATRYPSKNPLDIKITGKAGDIMKESVECALKVVINNIDNKLFTDGIHIHCPDTTTPKDGASAGIGFATSIYSLITNKLIPNDICMTGEIDLFGNVLMIGGLEAKLLGAIKAGCKIAIIPKDNEDDLNKIKGIEELNIILVKTIQEVFNIVF